MIQRIQTVYLLLVTVISAVHCCLLDNDVLNDPIAILTAICAIIAFVSIFLYKKRKWQIRLNILNAILFFVVLGFVILAFFIARGLPHVYNYLNIVLYFSLPIINIILTFLAIRAIRSDEALVKSLDRLR